MAELRTQTAVPIDREFPNPEIPTIFADGTMNLANSFHVVKFYLFRYDPSFTDSNKAKPQIAAQIVTSIDGFINTFAFFESAIGQLISQGIISKEQVDKARGTNRAIL